MKTILLSLFAFTTICLKAQQFKAGFFVPFDAPVKSTMPKMNTAVGIGVIGSYSPFFHAPVSIEFKANFGLYGSRVISQTYQFDDGSQTMTDVTYSSGMNKMLLGFKAMIGGDFRTIRGFVTPQIGVARFGSRISIADPQDTDGCHPLDQQITHRDRGMIYGLEAGTEINLSMLFPEIRDKGHNVIISASYLNGFDHFQYVNVRYMRDEIHTTMVGHESADLNARFINLSNNNIHEHKVAELYHTPFEFVSFQLGYVYRFLNSNNKCNF